MPRDVVAFDAHHLGSGQGGNETYSRELLRAWNPDESSVELVPVSAEARSALLSEVGWSGRSTTVPGGAARRWTYGLSRAAARVGADTLHTVYFAPLLRRRKLILTVHDASFRRHPEWFRTGYARVFDSAVSHAVSVADAIITISNSSAEELADIYPNAADKITAIPLAGPSVSAQVTRRRSAGATDRPFILYVGNFGERKNVHRLIAALATVRQISGHEDTRLVLAGNDDPQRVRAAVASHRLSDHVDILGRVDDDELVDLYVSAHVVAYVSLYEGFGLPIAEALAYGVPVVASDIPAHREVGGPAVHFVDPTDVESIAGGLVEAIEGPFVNAAGRARAQQWSWAATAASTAAVYRDVVTR